MRKKKAEQFALPINAGFGLAYYRSVVIGQCDFVQPKNTIEIKSGHLIISSFEKRYSELLAGAKSASVTKVQEFGKENEDEKNHKRSVFIRPVAANGPGSGAAAVPGELGVYRRTANPTVVHRRQVRRFHLLGLVFGSGVVSKG